LQCLAPKGRKPHSAFFKEKIMLPSTMMDIPLTIPSILERARLLSPTREVVSIMPVGINPETKALIPGIKRMTYGELYPRTMQLANALTHLGIKSGDRVATMALNHYRHFELYFAVPSIGAVCHMVNIRLHPDQIAYILNHAEDRVLFIDNLFLPMLPAILPRCPKLETVVVMGPVPGGLPAGTIDYEAFIAGESDHFDYPNLDERQASGMCYTSGTTGNPKGVLYSHRSIVLQSLTCMSVDMLGINRRDNVLVIVPMFHVNAWGYPYTCTMTGATQVYAGPFSLDAKILAQTMQDEGITMGGGVPTIWMAVLEELDRAKNAGTPYQLEALRALLVGGSAIPRAVIAAFGERHGINVINAWGMTETSPLGAVNIPLPKFDGLETEAKYDKMALTGRVAPLLDIKIVDGDGDDLGHGSKAMGRLMIRGPWVTASYYNDPNGTSSTQVDGWFDTGDIATIDQDLYMTIQDRAKDLIKSGGEWISSVDLENALMGHPAVREAAVIAIPHPKWEERPLGVLVLREGMSVEKAELDAFLAPNFAKWWLPDAYEIVSEIPKTTVGKFLKRAIREQFKDYRLSETPE
jgi:fatty-acyl-CoA synthase